MKAVIMAGGFGTRIQPLTINLPKPMIPLVNRPIMLHTVELLKKHGMTELILLLYHQPMSIKNFFGDGSEFGVRISYVTPLEDFGTAGAVKAAAKHLPERFLVISGDLLTDLDLSQALAYHEERQARATIALASVTDPLQFGVVITDQQGRIAAGGVADGQRRRHHQRMDAERSQGQQVALKAAAAGRIAVGKGEHRGRAGDE